MAVSVLRGTSLPRRAAAIDQSHSAIPSGSVQPAMHALQTSYVPDALRDRFPRLVGESLQRHVACDDRPGFGLAAGPQHAVKWNQFAVCQLATAAQLAAPLGDRGGLDWRQTAGGCGIGCGVDSGHGLGLSVG